MRKICTKTNLFSTLGGMVLGNLMYDPYFILLKQLSYDQSIVPFSVTQQLIIFSTDFICLYLSDKNLYHTKTRPRALIGLVSTTYITLRHIRLAFVVYLSIAIHIKKLIGI